jgi:mono/diheme cytochrome c family protein
MWVAAVCGTTAQRKESDSASKNSEYDVIVNRIALGLAALVILLAGCSQDDSSKSDAELGLNPQQSSGRHIYQQICYPCHDAHSVPGENGPSLQGVFRKSFLPSGLPANERFVRQTILTGRNMMPAAGASLTPQQLDDLLAYLHTR